VTQVSDILAGLIPRMLVGLLPGATGIDADAGRALYRKLIAVNQALNTLDSSDYKRDWLDTLARVADAEPANAIIRGYASRLLYDAGRLNSEQLETSFSLSLSLPSAAVEAALWIEGLLSGSGTVLIHDDGLRDIIDRWLCVISAERFIDVLPLLRRTFSQFSTSERRLIGHKVRGGAQLAAAKVTTDFDENAARSVLSTFNLIWGAGESS
jgi:hypothetical protein